MLFQRFTVIDNKVKNNQHGKRRDYVAVLTKIQQHDVRTIEKMLGLTVDADYCINFESVRGEKAD